METIDTKKFDEAVLPNDVLCDICLGEIFIGQTVFVEKATGTVYCEKCANEAK